MSFLSREQGIYMKFSGSAAFPIQTANITVRFVSGKEKCKIFFLGNLRLRTIVMRILPTA